MVITHLLHSALGFVLLGILVRRLVYGKGLTSPAHIDLSLRLNSLRFAILDGVLRPSRRKSRSLRRTILVLSIDSATLHQSRPRRGNCLSKWTVSLRWPICSCVGSVPSRSPELSGLAFLGGAAVPIASVNLFWFHYQSSILCYSI